MLLCTARCAQTLPTKFELSAAAWNTATTPRDLAAHITTISMRHHRLALSISHTTQQSRACPSIFSKAIGSNSSQTCSAPSKACTAYSFTTSRSISTSRSCYRSFSQSCHYHDGSRVGDNAHKRRRTSKCSLTQARLYSSDRAKQDGRDKDAAVDFMLGHLEEASISKHNVAQNHDYQAPNRRKSSNGKSATRSKHRTARNLVERSSKAVDRQASSPGAREQSQEQSEPKRRVVGRHWRIRNDDRKEPGRDWVHLDLSKAEGDRIRRTNLSKEAAASIASKEWQSRVNTVSFMPRIPILLANMSAMDLLNHEIDRFVAWLEPASYEHRVIDIVTKRFMDLCTISSPDTSYSPHGSLKTNLATSVSDIDMRATSMQEVSKRECRKMLRKLRDQIALGDEFEWSQMVEARWFVLANLKHNKSGLAIQFAPASRTLNQTEMTIENLRFYRNLRPLFFVIRTVLDVRDLKTVWTGGLGSYGTFNLLVAYLKNRKHDAKDSAGEMLIGFLDFAANLDVAQHQVSADTGELIPRHHQTTVNEEIVPDLSNEAEIVESKRELPSRHDLPLVDEENATASSIEKESDSPEGELLLRDHQPTAGAEAVSAAFVKVPTGKSEREMLPDHQKLSLLDAAAPKNDLGHNCFRWPDIQRLYKELHEELSASMNAFDATTEPKQKWTRSLIEPLVRGCQELYMPRRELIMKYYMERQTPKEPQQPVKPTNV